MVRAVQAWLAMRALVLVGWLLASCAPDPIVNCSCGSPGVAREALEGAFIYSVESVEVLAGEYTPPELPAPTTAFALASEDFLFWPLGDGDEQLVLRVTWQDVRPDPSRDGGCCPGWEGLAFTFPQPRWNERNRARVDWSVDIGGAVAYVDPTLERAEPVPFDFADDEGAVTLPFEPDADGRGLVVRADYQVTPTGCTGGGCTATVRVTHRMRRID